MYSYDPHFTTMNGQNPHFTGYHMHGAHHPAWAMNPPYTGAFNGSVWGHPHANWTGYVGYTPTNGWAGNVGTVPYWGNQTMSPTAPIAAPFSANAAAHGSFLSSNEGFYLLNRIEDIRAQLHINNELLRAEFARMTQFSQAAQMNQTAQTTPSNSGAQTQFHTSNNTYPYGVIPFHRGATTLGMGGGNTEVAPVRLRESEAYVYCDFFLPNLTIGDVEVEVTGNRIICRTRVPVAPISRWLPAVTQLPRGFEFFELPDGRVEYSWLCHVSFQAKDVEATFREGFLSVSVAKTETPVHRQPIKVAKEGSARRVANEMNS